MSREYRLTSCVKTVGVGGCGRDDEWVWCVLDGLCVCVNGWISG